MHIYQNGVFNSLSGATETLWTTYKTADFKKKGAESYNNVIWTDTHNNKSYEIRLPFL